MMQGGHGPVRGFNKRKIVLRFLSSCEGSIRELIDLVMMSFKKLIGTGCRKWAQVLCYVQTSVT